MKTLIRHHLQLIALLFCSLFSCAQAADNDRFLLQDNQGFVTSLPNVSDITVTQHLLELKQDLETEISLLNQEVQRKSFKAIDALVTVVMPGGLLYAKLRMDSFKRSEHRLNLISGELSEISDDLIVFQTDNDQLIISSIR